MNANDMIQVWQWRDQHAACEVGDIIDVVVTETLDFSARVVTVHSVGRRDGERENSVMTHDIDASVTPEAVARYRTAHGQVRIR